MYYLPAWNRGLIQIYYCYVLFLPFGKSFKYYEKYFNSISIYSWKQISLLTNIRNKFVIRNINLWFFDVMKKAKFSLQKFVPFNMITDSFLIEKWGTLECTFSKIFWQKLQMFVLKTFKSLILLYLAISQFHEL